MSNLHHHLPHLGQLGGDGVARERGREMVDHDQKEEHTKGQDKAKDEPHINHFDVGGWRQFVGHGLVQRVHHQHGCHGHPGGGLEVLPIEVESALAHKHEAEGGNEGGEQVVVKPPLKTHHHLQPSLHLLHLPVDDIVLQHLHRPTVHQLSRKE